MLSKNKLQEIVQEEYRSLPAFLFSKDAAENAPHFSASVSFCGLTFHSPGRFRTLKEAENAAADVAHDALLAKTDGEPMQTNAPAVPIDHKRQLIEFAVACGLHPPAYSTICDRPPHRHRFKATVNFDGQTFESPGFFVKVRQAERAAALAAFDSFSDRVSTLVGSPVGKILLEVKAQKEGSPLLVYMTTVTSTVKYNGMEFEGKPACSKRKAENNAAMVAWSALKEFKRSAVSIPQVPGDKGNAPVCESNGHPLIELINHLKDETTRDGSNVSAHNLPNAKRLAFQDQVKKVTMEVECLEELIRSIGHGSCTFREITQDTDQSQVQREKSVQNIVVDNASRWGISDGGDPPSNGWGSCGNFDGRSQHPTGS